MSIFFQKLAANWLADTTGAAVGAVIFVWFVTVVWGKIFSSHAKSETTDFR